jgi:hypothetical protein
MTDKEKKAIEKVKYDYTLLYGKECLIDRISIQTLLNLIEKQESIIKNACYIIKKTNKQFKDFDDIKLNEYLYNFDKCATIREE